MLLQRHHLLPLPVTLHTSLPPTRAPTPACHPHLHPCSATHTFLPACHPPTHPPTHPTLALHPAPTPHPRTTGCEEVGEGQGLDRGRGPRQEQDPAGPRLRAGCDRNAPCGLLWEAGRQGPQAAQVSRSSLWPGVWDSSSTV